MEHSLLTTRRTPPHAGMKANISFVFFGTPEFSVIVLSELENAGLIPALIVTAPDAPKGRGMTVLPSPVCEWARARNVRTITPVSLKDPETIDALVRTGADVFIIAAYGYIFPEIILSIPSKGVLNVHPSLLPKYRGATPIQGALLAGETETGVTIMLTDKELDHGPILAQTTVHIGGADATTVTPALAHAGGILAARVLPEWISGYITPTPQRHEHATFTKLLKKNDGKLSWNITVEEALRRIRAFQLWPTTWFEIPSKTGSVRVRILQARRLDSLKLKPPGTLSSIQNTPCIALRDGWLQLDRIRIAGKGDADGAAIWKHVTPETILQ